MKNISIIGGDARNFYLCELLKKDGFDVYTYALCDDEKLNMQECISKSEYIIVPIPFSKDSENVNCSAKNEKIKIEDFVNNVHNKIVIGGNINGDVVNLLEKKDNKVIDIMKNEELARKNAIPTVEGIVKIIIENTNITIDNSNIAILGFGRIGKQASKILSNMGANIFCSDIKKEIVANINLYGYNILENDYNLKNMDVIVNTVPQKILTEHELKKIDKKTLIVDISSRPGGVDFEYANKNDYKVIHALGLPGKIAPVTSAKYIKDIIEKIII